MLVSEPGVKAGTSSARISLPAMARSPSDQHWRGRFSGHSLASGWMANVSSLSVLKHIRHSTLYAKGNKTDKCAKTTPENDVTNELATRRPAGTCCDYIWSHAVLMLSVAPPFTLPCPRAGQRKSATACPPQNNALVDHRFVAPVARIRQESLVTAAVPPSWIIGPMRRPDDQPGLAMQIPVINGPMRRDRGYCL